MQEFAPNLSKIIPGRISKKRTVAQGLLGRKWVSNRWGGGGGTHCRGDSKVPSFIGYSR
jgi:hypothetical protein